MREVIDLKQTQSRWEHESFVYFISGSSAPAVFQEL